MERINAIYARQSVDKVDSISIESQIDFCKYETRGEGYCIYSDKGYSGKNIDRPQFQEMLSNIRNGKIRRVICYKLDRISRSILDFANMMNEFQKHNVEFVSCTEKFDTSTPMGRAMLNICIVFAQLERETIQQRVVDAYNSRSRKGFYMGGRIPYGYQIEPHIIEGKKTSKYAINPSEAEVVKIIYSIYADPQKSLSDVVDYLITHGIHNQRLEKGCWDRARISDMIKNPIYVKSDFSVFNFFHNQGTVIHNPPEEFMGNGLYLYSEKGEKRKSVSLENQHLVVAPHEGIVSSDVWLKARIKCLNNKQVAKPLKARNTWLAGKIKCAKCGYALVIKKSKTKIERYFVCSRRMQTKNGCEGSKGLYANEIENTVFTEIKEKLKQFKILSDSTSNKRSSENYKIDCISAKLLQIDSEISKLMNKLADADDVLTEYITSRIKELDFQKKENQKQKRELESSNIGSRNIIQITEYIDKWEELSLDDKRRTVDILISAVKVDDSNIEIVWKL